MALGGDQLVHRIGWMRNWYWIRQGVVVKFNCEWRWFQYRTTLNGALRSWQIGTVRLVHINTI